MKRSKKKSDENHAGFHVARASLRARLSNLAFARVLSVRTLPPRSGVVEESKDETEGFFYTVLSKEIDGDRKFFATRSTRARINLGGFVVGPAMIVDAALGRHHASAYPAPGDIVCGTPEANNTSSEKERAAASHVFTTWTGSGSALLELSKMMENGARMKAPDVLVMLRQPASDAARVFLEIEDRRQAGASDAPSMRGLRLARDAADEIGALALVVAFDDVRVLAVDEHKRTGRKLKRPMTERETSRRPLHLHVTASQFVKMLSASLSDGSPAAAFDSEFAEAEAPPPLPPPTHSEAISALVSAWRPVSPLPPGSRSESPAYVPTSPPRAS